MLNLGRLIPISGNFVANWRLTKMFAKKSAYLGLLAGHACDMGVKYSSYFKKMLSKCYSYSPARVILAQLSSKPSKYRNK
jgi:hypothetical protein